MSRVQVSAPTGEASRRGALTLGKLHIFLSSTSNASSVFPDYFCRRSSVRRRSLEGRSWAALPLPHPAPPRPAPPRPALVTQALGMNYSLKSVDTKCHEPGKSRARGKNKSPVK
ncbi:hypothetical protein E2C01_051877 [Portunus trituberculatus]|uniref:Uncharacterized protein n=1 Tax=Portunus trituberculatus TaxID=210409 RepID=A0A5B7GKV7_PORTR|nr:hypothetical protein [Portunus trituberculatus]